MIKEVLKTRQSLWALAFQQESLLSNAFPLIFIMYLLYVRFSVREVNHYPRLREREEGSPKHFVHPPYAPYHFPVRLLGLSSIGGWSFQVYLQIKETQTLRSRCCSQPHMIIKIGILDLNPDILIVTCALFPSP